MGLLNLSISEWLLPEHRHPLPLIPRVSSVTRADRVTGEHVDEFISSLLRSRSPATAANRFRSLRVFFRFLLERGYLDSSPMAGLKAPRVPLKDVPVLDEDELGRLLATCSGRRDFHESRDYAILRLFITTGARQSEIAGLTLDSVDFEDGTARVIGKGSRTRVVSLDGKTLDAVAEYVRMREGVAHLDHKSMWVTAGGRLLSGWGVDQIARRSARQAGLDGFHLHVLRHSFADLALAKGMSEGDLMRVAGWNSRSMLDRYGRANAQRRANTAHRDLLDRLGL